MNLASKSFCLVIASAALVLAGCAKKPARPDPGSTLIGQQPGGAGVMTPVDVPLIADGGLGPEKRPDGFENGLNRSLLSAHAVYFDYDKSDIKPAERTKLQAAKDYLAKNPTHRLLLEGHCDWRGTAEYNLSLGDRRANAAKKYLQSIGVAADKLEVVSKGSLEASKNADDATMAKDRRVDLVVVNAKPGFAPL